MAKDDPLGVFGGGAGGGIMDFLSSIPGLGMVSSLLGLFGGGSDGPGSFEDTKGLQRRFLAPSETLGRANAAATGLGAGLTRRLQQPLGLQTPMPGKLSNGMGMEPTQLNIPGLDLSELMGVFNQASAPKPLRQSPKERIINRKKELKAYGSVNAEPL